MARRQTIIRNQALACIDESVNESQEINSLNKEDQNVSHIFSYNFYMLKAQFKVVKFEIMLHFSNHTFVVAFSKDLNYEWPCLTLFYNLVLS